MNKNKYPIELLAMSAATRRINIQYQNYLQLKSSITDEEEWIRDYGYYLFKSEKLDNQWYGLVVGPSGTLYNGALLLVRIRFPPDFPFSPPKIENCLPFPKMFNNNLWSADSVQNLMCNDGQYKPFYGLICMDILNTPHSKMEQNQWGEYHEVYDKSREQYSPVMNICMIMMSLRSNILSGETRLSHITDDALRLLCVKYLAFAVLNDGYQVADDERDEVVKLLEPLKPTLFRLFNRHYRATIRELLEVEEIKSEADGLRPLYNELRRQYLPPKSD